MVGVECVGQLNELIRNDKIKHFMMLNQARHDQKIVAIANQVYTNFLENGTKLILIAGPSASGKSNFFPIL